MGGWRIRRRRRRSGGGWVDWVGYVGGWVGGWVDVFKARAQLRTERTENGSRVQPQGKERPPTHPPPYKNESRPSLPVSLVLPHPLTPPSKDTTAPTHSLLYSIPPTHPPTGSSSSTTPAAANHSYQPPKDKWKDSLFSCHNQLIPSCTYTIHPPTHPPTNPTQSSIPYPPTHPPTHPPTPPHPTDLLALILPCFVLARIAKRIG